MIHHQTNNRFCGVVRPCHIGGLLRIGPWPLSVAWSNAERSIHCAGIGVAGESLSHQIANGDVTVDWLDSSILPPAGPWFGGWAFGNTSWDGFDVERWVLPEILAWWDGRRAYAAAFGPAGTSVLALLEKLQSLEEIDPITDNHLVELTTNDDARWTLTLDKALRALDDGDFEKVVIARDIEVQTQGEFSERRILKALEARFPTCWTFLTRGRDGRAFVGASPETLIEIDGDVVRCDALAGTAMVGGGAALLESPKIRREHQAVVHDIVEVLEGTCDDVVRSNDPCIRRLANVEHLYTAISAQKRVGVRGIEIARMLHPTPAVGGRPRQSALQFIETHEQLDRGWYSGVVGAMNANRLTLAVALRSALLDKSSARLFVGAGIVQGSTPEDEWIETERKAQAMLTALGVARVAVV